MEEFNDKIENFEESIEDKIYKADSIFNKNENLKFDTLCLEDYIQSSDSNKVIILKYD